jgi:hypothetical protein
MRVDRDYRTLLADGVVGWRGDPDQRDEIYRWAEALARLAESDGLRARVMWCHAGEVAWAACVELTKRDGEPLEGPNVFPYDQATMAQWIRPLAIGVWGKTLKLARRRAGI